MNAPHPDRQDCHFSVHWVSGGRGCFPTCLTLGTWLGLHPGSFSGRSLPPPASFSSARSFVWTSLASGLGHCNRCHHWSGWPQPATTEEMLDKFEQALFLTGKSYHRSRSASRSSAAVSLPFPFCTILSLSPQSIANIHLRAPGKKRCGWLKKKRRQKSYPQK